MTILQQAVPGERRWETRVQDKASTASKQAELSCRLLPCPGPKAKKVSGIGQAGRRGEERLSALATVARERADAVVMTVSDGAGSRSQMPLSRGVNCAQEERGSLGIGGPLLFAGTAHGLVPCK